MKTDGFIVEFVIKENLSALLPFAARDCTGKPQRNRIAYFHTQRDRWRGRSFVEFNLQSPLLFRALLLPVSEIEH